MRGWYFDEPTRHGANVALIEGDRSVSHAELAAEANAFAAELGEPRSLVFLECRNTIQSVAAYLGCLRAHHAVYLFAGLDDDRLAALVATYEPNALVRCDPAPTLRRFHSRRLELHRELCVLLSTSGSTGTPKLVKLSRRNLQSNSHAIVDYLGLTASDRAITSLCFAHAYGMSVLNSHLECGAALILTERSTADDAFWDSAARHGATSFSGVPHTFEALERSGRLEGLTSLRRVTQAGGRLSARLVRHFALLGRARGWRWFVMYGQTEAAPRIAYLPPELAPEFPDCIGMAIPGGRISLRGVDGEEIVEADRPGELVYAGPNVMMGYASSLADLRRDDHLSELATGDIACRNAAGLFYIVDRSARFVKPRGLRISLDDVERLARERSPSACATGTDARILIGVLESDRDSLVAGLGSLAKACNLPTHLFEVVPLERIPRLGNGKVDYRAIVARAAAAARPEWRASARRFLATIASPEFFRQAFREAARLVGMGEEDWASVASIYSLVLDRRVEEDDTFVALDGDSLSSVQLSLALEEYLGWLPPEWERCSVGGLERMKSNAGPF